MTPLVNPERDWEPPARARTLDPSEVERRIGPVDREPEILSGGLANVNVRLDAARVLRVYRSDPRDLAKEAALLGLGWHLLVVPGVVARGDDFLVLDYVEHTQIEDVREHGAALGLALAEIHTRRFDEAGFLDPELEVREPFADWFATLRDYAMRGLGGAVVAPAVRDAVGAFLRTHEAEYRGAVPSCVLLHADFKASNLFWTRQGLPLVLDWEFAWSGPSLMDVGQLFRWSPSPSFAEAFAGAYRGAGGSLPNDWLRLAAMFDLFNLSGLLEASEPSSRRAADVTARILRTLGEG